MNILRTRLAPGFLGIVAGLCAALPCTAQEVTAGWESAPSNGYAFASVILAYPFSSTDSFVVKPTATYLYYDYRETPGVTKVEAPGVSLALAYRYSDPRLTLTIGPAIEVLWESRDRATGIHDDDTKVGALIGGDVFFQVTPLTNLNLISSYDQTNRYFFARGGIKQRVTDLEFNMPWALLLGAEITGQGNKDVKQYGAGGLVEFAFNAGRTSLQLRAGYTHLEFSDHTDKSRPYVGVGLYQRL